MFYFGLVATPALSSTMWLFFGDSFGHANYVQQLVDRWRRVRCDRWTMHTSDRQRKGRCYRWMTGGMTGSGHVGVACGGLEV